MISEGHEEWAKWNKMICNHTDPHMRAKHPNPLGTPITYMESQGALKAIKTSEYGPSHFYQVQILGDFSMFPEPWELMTSDDVCCLLKCTQAGMTKLSGGPFSGCSHSNHTAA